LLFELVEDIATHALTVRQPTCQGEHLVDIHPIAATVWSRSPASSTGIASD
jgi:hypothetical protein